MATLKKNKWVRAHRVRVVRKNGRDILEIQRVTKRKTRINAGPQSRRKTKKVYYTVTGGAGSHKAVDRQFRAKSRATKARRKAKKR